MNVLWAEAQNDADQYRETVRNQQREATTSQSERITKRARHKASMRRCTVSPLSRHNAVQKRRTFRNSRSTATVRLPLCRETAQNRPLPIDRGGPRPGRTDRGGQDTPRDTPADQVTKVRRDVPRATRRSSLFLAFVDDVQQSQGDGIN